LINEFIKKNNIKANIAMTNLNNSLTTFIRADYYTSKLMKRLIELSCKEYSLENYGECNKRCIQWLRLYSIMLPKYKDYVGILNGENVEKRGSDSYRWNFMINALHTSNYDRVIRKHMDCHKFLVGPTVYQLVQKINQSLPIHEQWDAFMTYQDIVDADNGLNSSSTRESLLSHCKTTLKQTHILNQKVDNTAILDILDKIHFKWTIDTNDQIKENTEIQMPELITDQLEEWAYILPEEFKEKIDKVETELKGHRLTNKNAKIDMIISYSTKKGIEYGRISKITETSVETDRLKKDKDGKFVPHHVGICKSSGNKPMFTRVITIVE
jgi:hypothetical protein